jgi:hypothetical protein
MNRTKIVRLAGAAAAVGALGLAGATLAGAAATPTPSPSSSSGDGPGGKGHGHDHTPVTGDELAKVKAAVKAKDSAITVTEVEKDADGSYDVDGTKAGARVRVEVSADLRTVEVRTGGPGWRGGHGPGGPRHTHTAVTGDELAKVTAAVRAKDSAVTVTRVEKDADGSYDVEGTKAGQPVRLEVSQDLRTISEASGWGPGGKGPKDRGTDVTGTERSNVEKAAKAKVSGLAVEEVRKRADGSYVVKGTKAGAPVRVEVSKDLKTVTERSGWGRGGHPGKGPGHRGGGVPTPAPTGTT